MRPASSGIGAAVAGLTTAVRYACHTLDVESGVELLAIVRRRFGPLTEAAIIAEILAFAFTKGTNPS